MTQTCLSHKQRLLVAGTLFGMFFGAGNLIFPVHLGQLAGRQFLPAAIGFILTAVGIPILGVAAIGSTHSEGLQDLSRRVGHRYSYFFTCLLYLTIGPFFAIPRCATTSFTAGVRPLLGTQLSEQTMLFLFSLIFFALVFVFSIRPGSITLWIGKIINPLFLLFLGVLIVTALLHPSIEVSAAVPDASYQNGAFFSALSQGYETMDAIAGLAFGIVVISVIRQMGVREDSTIAKEVLHSGMLAGLLMAFIYLLTILIGVQSLGQFELSENGGIALNTTRGFALAHGEYITLLDHDDVLYPNALFEVVQTIQNTGADFVYSDEIVLSADLKELGGYHFKPDFAPDYLRGVNFITHLAVFSRPLLDAAGAYESKEFDGAQDHDLILRLTEKAQRIEHIKKVLYIWRAAAGSTAAGMEAKPYAVAAGERAIDAQLKRLGLPGHAMAVPDAPGAFQVRYELTGHPKISVLIPSKDHIDDLDRCLTSLYKNAGYDNFEVIVIENNSTDPATFAYYETLPSRFADCRVVYYKGVFNFSAINNFGATFAEGEHLLLLNNDIEVLSHDFLRELLSYSQRPDVGAVGAKLYYPDDTIQHAGVLMGINGSAGHSHKSYPRTAVGDMYRLVTTQNYMAVTGACLMTKASLYRAFGGLDEEKFAVAYNDVDYCLKLWQKGLLNVYTPRAEAYHYESKSRGLDTLSENAKRYEREKANFYAKYQQYIDNYDPYYNPHFNNLFENFGLK